MRVRGRDLELEHWVIGGVVTLLVGVVGLVGYEVWTEATEIEAGTVYEKEYLPETYTTVCTTVNKVTTCTPQHHPECYEVRYRDLDGETGDACVAPGEYEAYTEGDEFP